MRRINYFVLLFVFIVFYLSGNSRTVEQLWAGISSKDSIEVFTSLEMVSMYQSSDYIEADSNLTMSKPEGKSLDELEIRTGFFNWVDYITILEPPMLWWRHNRYWVDVISGKTTFRVLYFDPYGTLPSAGYPRVDYRIKGQGGTFASLVLGYEGDADGGRIYSSFISLSTGCWEYQYVAKNPNRLNEYRLELSSFVVSSMPGDFENSGAGGGVIDGEVVSSAKVILSWRAKEPDTGGTLYYKVYLGTSTSSMALIYEGYGNFCEVRSLDYGKEYLWQVEAINVYGVSARSALWKFKTIERLVPGKAFNYPNPFNPNQGATSIVFDMAQSGKAEVSVYTELGDLVCRKSCDGLLRGANEISYDGRDDSGRVLYSGPYVVIIKKTYLDGSQSQDRCRLLVIK